MALLKLGMFLIGDRIHLEEKKNYGGSNVAQLKQVNTCPYTMKMLWSSRSGTNYNICVQL